MKRIGLGGLAHRAHAREPYRWTVDRVWAALRAFARVLRADRALAQRAARRAEASPRRNQAELRAMYVPPRDADRW